MGTALLFLAFTLQVGCKEKSQDRNQQGPAKGDALPWQAYVQTGGKEGGAGEISQRPHGLHAGHQTFTHFTFNVNAVYIDDNVEEAQGRTEAGSRSDGQGIGRHIAEGIEEDNDGQAAQGQGTAAAEAGGNGAGKEHHQQGAEADGQKQEAEQVIRNGKLTLQKRNKRSPGCKAEAAEKVERLGTVNLPKDRAFTEHIVSPPNNSL